MHIYKINVIGTYNV